jgi:molecular chaperone GrpE
VAEQRDEALRPEAAADDPAAASEAAEPAEERLNEASPDDAAGAAGRPEEAAEAPADAEPDYQDKYVRAVAELDNVRKRLLKQAREAEVRGVARAARELLPAIDDLERALQAAPEDDPMREGVRIVHERLLASLGRLGIEADAPKGEAFDPHRHEAITQMAVDGAESGTVVEVYSAGYRLGDQVLRAAKVVVAQ